MLLDNYTSPWMDEELHIMRNAVAKFLEKEFVPCMEKWEKQGFLDRDAWLKAGEAGLLCASIPAQYGGGGGNFKHEMVLVEELSYANITGFRQWRPFRYCSPLYKLLWNPRAEGKMVAENG